MPAPSTSALDDGVVDVALSDDGRFVAFTTSADDVVPGDTNQNSDVFVRDRETQRTSRESIGSDGAQIGWASRGVSMSGDGSVVSFITDGTPFVDPTGPWEQWVFVVRDRGSGVTAVTPIAWVGAAALAGNGRSAVMYAARPSPAQTDLQGDDVVVYDVGANSAVRIAPATSAPNTLTVVPPAISADGRYVAFWSTVDGIVPADDDGERDAFVYDREVNTLRRLGSNDVDAVPDPGYAIDADDVTSIDISDDGQVVSFDRPPSGPGVFVNTADSD